MNLTALNARPLIDVQNVRQLYGGFNRLLWRPLYAYAERRLRLD